MRVAAQIAVLLFALLGAGFVLALAPAPTEPAPLALVEVRSWVVLGRGRHMYARITAPPGHERLSTVVEYTGAFMRSGYVRPEAFIDQDRIVKARRGERVLPMLDVPMDQRLEAVYWLPLETIEELQRDRAFAARYFLTGPNSSSGLRAAFESSGIPLPSAMFGLGGVLGEFPGIEYLPGAEIEARDWPRIGFADGPEASPGAE
ncbi:MAG: hypothetical protein ACTS27_10550 [Phycisphaerales bacterium]